MFPLNVIFMFETGQYNEYLISTVDTDTWCFSTSGPFY